MLLNAHHKRRAVLCPVAILAALALLRWLAIDSDASSDVRAESVRAEHETHERAPLHTRLPAERGGSWSVAGYVRNEHGGAVGNARVCAVCATCDVALGVPARCTRSEPSGAYALDLLDSPAVTVSASAAGYRPGHANAGRALQREGTRGQVDIVLPNDGARLAGTVLDALGGPVPDARVLLWRASGALQALVETRADDEGKFELWAPPGHAAVRVEAAGYAPVSRGVVAPSADIALQLTPAGTISGTVIDRASGKPVADVEVRALFEGMRGRSLAAMSGYDGQFSVTGLEPGRYLLSAEHERFRAASPPAVQLGLAQVVKAVTVPLVPAVSVHGQILSDDAHACVGGRVTLDPTGISQQEGASASPTVSAVEPDGRVHLRGLMPGRYRVELRCADHVLADGASGSQLDIRDQDVHATWRVTRGLGLEISVLDAVDQPVPHASLVMQRTSAERAGATVFTPLSADASGKATTGLHLSPGTYTVRPGGALRGEPVTIELRPGTGASPITVRVSGSAWLDVDVRDEHGKPVDGLQVSARAADAASPRKLAPARPLGAGEYRVGPLEAGRYSVHAADGVNRSWGEASEHATISVPSQGTVRTTLQIERAGRLAGEVVDAHGQPAANVWVTVKDETVKGDPLQRLAVALSTQRRLTDVDGHFEIDGLSTRGRYVVSVTDPEAGEGSVHDVQAGAPVTVALTHPTPIASSAGDR